MTRRLPSLSCDRRHFLSALGMGALASPFLARNRAAAAVRKQPNVPFIAVDDRNATAIHDMLMVLKNCTTMTPMPGNVPTCPATPGEPMLSRSFSDGCPG